MVVAVGAVDRGTGDHRAGTIGAGEEDVAGGPAPSAGVDVGRGRTDERRADTLLQPVGADAPAALANDPAQNLANATGRTGALEVDITNGSNPPSVTPASLEGSNVSAVDALVRLMDYNRSFESNIRMIKEAKATDESGTSMMRAPS